MSFFKMSSIHFGVQLILNLRFITFCFITETKREHFHHETMRLSRTERMNEC